jgi:hypothetical protein
MNNIESNLLNGIDFYPIKTLQKQIDNINSYKNPFVIYMITKKRNNKYPSKLEVKDGAFLLAFNVINLQCECSNNLCNHKLYIMSNIFNLDSFTIWFILNDVDIYDKYKQIIKNISPVTIIDKKEFNNVILEEIYTKYKEDECIICNHLIYDRTFTIYKCNNCKKLVHSECIEKWHNYNHYEIKNCIFCRN